MEEEANKEAEEVRIILAIADEHLDQAGSLLSSVRRDQRGAVEEGGLPLALDIETNIGRLEETRERIDNAIEIYQAVRERRGEVGGDPPPPPHDSPSVTFQATVNVEHKVKRELKEVVITRTSRGRRSGVEDDRREGQLWEGKLDGGSSPGECNKIPPRHNLALFQQQKVPASFNTCYFCKQTQNHGGEVTNSAAPAVARTTWAAKSCLKIGQSIASSTLSSLSGISGSACRLLQSPLFAVLLSVVDSFVRLQQAVSSQSDQGLIGFGRVIAVAPRLVIFLFI